MPVCSATGADKILVQLTGPPLTLADGVTQCVFVRDFSSVGVASRDCSRIEKGAVKSVSYTNSCLSKSTMQHLYLDVQLRSKCSPPPCELFSEFKI